MTDDGKFSPPNGDFSIRIGREQIDVERRWEAVSILNDIMVGVWFITGSILNIAGASEDLALYLYLAGSSQLLLRAILRLGRRIHIRRGYERSRPRIYRPSRHNPT